MQNFDKNLRQVIKEFAYDMYVVQQYNDVQCTCIDPVSKQGDPNCQKCLGRGFKIVIKKIKGVKQLTNSVSFRTRGTSEKVNTPVFYFDADYPVKAGNLIIDRDEVYVLQAPDVKYSDNRNVVYYISAGVPVKAHAKTILQNFNKIVGGAK